MLTNDELKKKISQIISEYCCPYGKTHKQLYGDDRMCYSKMNFAECNPITECTDALIAAGIGDVEKQHDVFKKAYMDFFTKLNLDKNFRKNFDSTTLGCQIGKFEDMIEQAEKELAELKGDNKR